MILKGAPWWRGRRVAMLPVIILAGGLATRLRPVCLARISAASARSSSMLTVLGSPGRMQSTPKLTVM